MEAVHKCKNEVRIHCFWHLHLSAVMQSDFVLCHFIWTAMVFNPIESALGVVFVLVPVIYFHFCYSFGIVLNIHWNFRLSLRGIIVVWPWHLEMQNWKLAHLCCFWLVGGCFFSSPRFLQISIYREIKLFWFLFILRYFALHVCAVYTHTCTCTNTQALETWEQLRLYLIIMKIYYY